MDDGAIVVCILSVFPRIVAYLYNGQNVRNGKNALLFRLYTIFKAVKQGSFSDLLPALICILTQNDMEHGP